MSEEDPIGDTIVELLQRSTLALSQPGGVGAGTAFLYNHLVESTSDSDLVIEFLITAGPLARGEVGEIRLRPDMISPAGAASDLLLMTKFADQWNHDGASGTAFMTFAGLHEHGRRKGWSWVTQEVTDGLAARAQDVAEIAAGPEPAYVLGHGVDGTERPLTLVRGGVRRDREGTMRWFGPGVEDLTGSPVFVPRLVSGRGVRIVCLGLLQTGGPDSPIGTFDLIRRAIEATIPPLPA